jgi:hypothetical protein
MLLRLETRTRNGDGLDQLLDTLPEEALFATCNCLRDRLGLETKQPPVPKKKQPTADDDEEGAGAGASAIKNTEYNSANKAENLFGVKMYNRYLFALDN